MPRVTLLAVKSYEVSKATIIEIREKLIFSRVMCMLLDMHISVMGKKYLSSLQTCSYSVYSDTTSS